MSMSLVELPEHLRKVASYVSELENANAELTSRVALLEKKAAARDLALQMQSRGLVASELEESELEDLTNNFMDKDLSVIKEAMDLTSNRMPVGSVSEENNRQADPLLAELMS